MILYLLIGLVIISIMAIDGALWTKQEWDGYGLANRLFLLSVAGFIVLIWPIPTLIGLLGVFKGIRDGFEGKGE